MRYRHIFGMGAFIALFFAMCMPAEGQMNVERLESIARHVARAVLAEGDSLTAEQVAWVERMTPGSRPAMTTCGRSHSLLR
ncbi:MAG: hypothetical protein OXI23_05070, partial [Gemmatimonadota bacterium]|nr:hypothetical protein [Gemmatimonadota bacterium]